ncbi:MAG: toprim domain-containing protein [Desulfobacteraceae bacterium]|nr:toprim domain-containing protein [Desulfobacteraceae bacterium]
MTNLDEINSISVLDIASRLGLKVRGRKALCFDGHDRKTRSLSFEPQRNIWTCFGCGKKGDSIQLVIEILSCDFWGALEWFRDNYGIQLSKSRYFSDRSIRKYNKHATKVKKVKRHSKVLYQEVQSQPDIEFLTWFLNKCGPVKAVEGIEYLNSHGISLELANKFSVRELGNPSYAFAQSVKKWGAERVSESGLTWRSSSVKPNKLIWSSYSLLFPFFHEDKVVYIQGRLFAGSRKFVNPAGILKPLFNETKLDKLTPSESIHLCEGIPDAIALEGEGLAAVAVLGATSFKESWIDKFIPYNVIIMPDGDSGGNTFAETMKKYFAKRGKSISVIQAPQGADVASIVAKQKDKGNL